MSYGQEFITPIVPNTPGNVSKIYKYTPGDVGIFYNTTGGNEWAIVNAGREDGDEDGACDSKLFNMKTGEIFKVEVAPGIYLRFKGGSVDANVLAGRIVTGNIATNKAATYNRSTGKLNIYPDRFDADGGRWRNGHLTGCTPDGKFAYGYYQGYVGPASGDADLPQDWWYRPLLVDVEKGEVIKIDDSVLPRGGSMEAYKLTGISADGRYVRGEGNWFMEGGASFVYDTQTKKCVNASLNSFEDTHGETVADVLARLQKKHPELISISGLSPATLTKRTYRCNATFTAADGTQKTAMAVYFREVKGDGDIADRDEDIKIYDEIEDGGVYINHMDDNGTCYGMTETGGPLRNFKILYDGKYWVPFNQICKQKYGYDFYDVTAFERSGTIMGVSPDGHRLISYVDPMGESFCFDFGMTAHEACEGLDFLGSYTAMPEDGSQFETVGSVELTFERPVRILGTGKNIHLYNSKGELVREGLSTSSALQFKQNSKTTVIAAIRNTTMNEGEEYTFVIDAGTFVTEKSDDCLSKEIRIKYIGRKGPVKIVSSAPEEGTKLSRLDNQSSYVIMSFDSKVKLVDGNLATARLEHEDGTYAGTMTMVPGYLEETKHQVLLYPASTINLYEGQKYNIVIEPGMLCDYSGSEKSYNERLVLQFEGGYVRPIPTGEVLFYDAWDDIAESLSTWLRYEGDHLTPQYTPQSWGFDKDNQPWNFSIHESNENPDYCAGSHSMYAPSGKSDDWMITPQIVMPEEGKVVLEFDAQNYIQDVEDVLNVYVYADKRVISYLNDNNMKEIREGAQLVFSEVITPGATREGLADEWTHYEVDLTPWDGQEIYIAFVNENYNKSAIFVDNVTVRRELLCELSLDYDEIAVAADEQKVSGKITVKTDKCVTAIRMELLDAEGREIDNVEWNNIAFSKGTSLPFSFATPLPLRQATVNDYAINVKMTIDDEVRSSEVKSQIMNLTFRPKKRVVLEEMTGIDCPNCPLGIVTIEKLRRIHGDRIIPVSLHTYTGDPYAVNVMSYSDGLGLLAAPSARIDRTNGVYYPFKSVGTTYMDSGADEPLWIDIVAERMNRLPLCDIAISASPITGTRGEEITYTANVTYAIDAADQQLSLLFVVLEDSIENYQQNAFGGVDSPLLMEWGMGGSKSAQYVYPFMHNDVARGIVGNNFGGSIGLFPSLFTADETVTASIKQSLPTNILDASNLHVVGMLIDTQTGEVINAAECRYGENGGADGIESISSANSAATTVYSITGQRVSSLRKGSIYIKNGVKMIAR